MASNARTHPQSSRQVEQQIDEGPRPDGYNQWAWLVSNTEGDFQKAIRYSHRSLELIPRGSGESAGASFLDTLGPLLFRRRRYRERREVSAPGRRESRLHASHESAARAVRKALAEKQGAAERMGNAKGEPPENPSAISICHFQVCDLALKAILHPTLTISHGRDNRLFDRCAGPPVLLIHGFPLDHTMWPHRSTRYAERCRVIAPDLRGFGESSLGDADPNTASPWSNTPTTWPSCSICSRSRTYRARRLFNGRLHRVAIYPQACRSIASIVQCDTQAAADSEEARAGRLKMAEKVAEWGSGRVAEMMGPSFAGTFETKPKVVEAVRKVVESTSPDAIAAAHRGMAARPDMTGFCTRPSTCPHSSSGATRRHQPAQRRCEPLPPRSRRRVRRNTRRRSHDDDGESRSRQ